MQTNKADRDSGVGAPAMSSGKPPRRLGRGLSSLLGTPVKVEVEAAATAVQPHSPPSEEHRSADRSGNNTGSVRQVQHSRAPARDGAESQTSPARSAQTDGTAAGAGAASGGGVGDGAGSRPGVEMLAIDTILPSRFQPRRKFEEGALAELAASIRSAGVVQPVLVRPLNVSAASSSNVRYELIAGERRWRAAGLAGLSRVPAVVADLADEQAAEWALIENVQRADLSAMETAYAVRELCERFGLTHAQAGEKLGLDRTSITNLVRLTDLEPGVRELLEAGTLSAGHGKVLLGMAPGARRAALAARAAAAGWSVRRLGGAVSMMMKGAGEDEASQAGIQQGAGRGTLAHAGMRELEKQLGEHLGTKVQIRVRGGGKRGTLRIDFYDLDHFDGLMAKMGFVMQ